MVFRFQRRLRLAPGVRVNVGLRGMSLSLGPRGSSVTVGSRGIYSNLGIPGTGLSTRQRLDGGNPRAPGRRASPVAANLSGTFTLRFSDDGKTTLLDSEGGELSPSMVRKLRDEDPDSIKWGLERAVDLINADLHDCLGVHLRTPAPVAYRPLARPDRPTAGTPRLSLRPFGFWDRVFFRRKSIERDNDALRRRHAEEVEAWERDLAQWRARSDCIVAINAGVLNGSQAEMEEALAELLSAITWAKETEVAFDFGGDSSTLDLDIDLPTLDEMPHRTAEMPARGINLKISKRTDPQRRRDFLRLVAGSCFRVAGEAFAGLPTLKEVTVSGFTQRPDPSTGGVEDVYVISVLIRREDWEEIDFGALELVEPESALARFDLRIKPDRTSMLQEITPH